VSVVPALSTVLPLQRSVTTTYQEIARWIGESDPTTRRMTEKILAEEGEHAGDLNDLLGN
jgi:bacterioferritin